MTRGIGEWADIAGRTLLIVNSPPDAGADVAAVLDRLQPHDGDREVHVIAPIVWRAWLVHRQWRLTRTLFATDADGREIELNYFLEQLDTLHWIVARKFAVVIGTAPHNLYNEEIKDTFERRVALFLGDGMFISHALPQPQVYFLGLADLLRRLGRDRRTREYLETTRALIGDLHDRWLEEGRPNRADGEASDVKRGLAKHLGPLLAFDEASETEGAGLVRVDAIAEFLGYVERVLHPALGLRDDRLRELDETVERQRVAVETRDRLLAELHEAMGREVQGRDERIVELANELQREVQRRDERIVELANELQREVQRRDERIKELAIESSSENQIRDDIIAKISAERKTAVSERDAIIDDLRRQLDRMGRR